MDFKTNIDDVLSKNIEHNSDCNRVSLGEFALKKLFHQYERDENAIQVNFRDIASWIPYGERASHMIHLYPAKLLPHIPAFFLANQILSKEGDLVLDPFSGSGTVMLEAILAKRCAAGSDSNPLARLISKVKTTKLDSVELLASFRSIKERIKLNEPIVLKPDVVNIDYWFHAHVIEQLSRIKQAIQKISDRDIREFFEVSFSNTIKRSSLADPRLSVPVRLKKEKYELESINYVSTEKLLKKLENLNVYELFYKLSKSNIDRLDTLNKLIPTYDNGGRIFDDARSLTSDNDRLNDESVQLIITSPPYAGAQKYIRSSGLNLGWLDQCPSDGLRYYEKLNIGREHHNKSEYSSFLSTGIPDADEFLLEIYKIKPLRSYIAAKYIVEMKEALTEAYRVLKPGGYIVLVSSSNKICNQDFETHKYLSQIAIGLGLKIKLRLIDDIHSRGLMTKRNKTAGIINCEWVYVFKKDL